MLRQSKDLMWLEHSEQERTSGRGGWSGNRAQVIQDLALFVLLRIDFNEGAGRAVGRLL